jgi:hypothetical protein
LASSGTLDITFGSLPLDASLSVYSRATFRSRWDAVLDFLGVPHFRATGSVLPVALRGSGATEFYFHTEDIPRIAWRCHWRRPETLEHYLQDVAAQLFLGDLSLAVQKRVRFFATAASAVTSAFCAVGPAYWLGGRVARGRTVCGSGSHRPCRRSARGTRRSVGTLDTDSD